jgi:hypothetical protein
MFSTSKVIHKLEHIHAVNARNHPKGRVAVSVSLSPASHDVDDVLGLDIWFETPSITIKNVTRLSIGPSSCPEHHTAVLDSAQMGPMARRQCVECHTKPRTHRAPFDTPTYSFSGSSVEVGHLVPAGDQKWSADKGAVLYEGRKPILSVGGSDTESWDALFVVLELTEDVRDMDIDFWINVYYTVKDRVRTIRGSLQTSPYSQQIPRCATLVRVTLDQPGGPHRRFIAKLVVDDRVAAAGRLFPGEETFVLLDKDLYGMAVPLTPASLFNVTLLVDPSDGVDELGALDTSVSLPFYDPVVTFTFIEGVDQEKK